MVKGEFPNLLKIAQITPIPKITSPKSPNDCRPISKLPTLSKLGGHGPPRTPLGIATGYQFSSVRIPIEHVIVFRGAR